MSQMRTLVSMTLSFLRSGAGQLGPGRGSCSWPAARSRLRDRDWHLVRARQHFLSTNSEQSASEKSYSVVRIGPEQREAVAAFLRKFFFRDEPLNIALGISREKSWPNLEEYSLSPLEQGLTVGALSNDGSLVGVCINAAGTSEEDTQDREHWNSIADDLPEDSTNLIGADEKFKQIKRLLMRVNADYNIYKENPGLDKAFDICILSVDDGWRGMGIAKKLIDKSKEVALAEGFSVMRCVCSSHFSALAVSRLGYSCVHRLFYKDILDKKGQAIFRPAPPHEAVTVYVLKF